jgi:GT2 family glycosyltransferase
MALSLLVIVLHYKNLSDTLECVASLGKQSFHNAHVIVVENGAAEKAGASLAAHYPWVEVLDLEENRGWSGGNNAGIRLAIARGYDFVCLLNNDTVLPANALIKLMDTAAGLGRCILHPAIDSYGEDHEVQLDPTIPQPPDLRVTPVPGHDGVFAINILNGSCVLIDTDIFRQIGLIDERFFLMCEDIDLGARAVAAGVHLFCDIGVRIQHKESQSFGGRRKPIKTYYGMRNMLLYMQKHERQRRTFFAYGRDLGWMIWSTAVAAGIEPRSWFHLLYWSLSRDMFARAVRIGLRDFLLRRFGRLNKRDEALLTPRSGSI